MVGKGSFIEAFLPMRDAMYNQEKSTSPVANDEEHFQYDFGVTAIFYILSLASAALAIAAFVIRRRINGYDRAVKAIEMEIAKK
jgi:hypothetical protein